MTTSSGATRAGAAHSTVTSPQPQISIQGIGTLGQKDVERFARAVQGRGLSLTIVPGQPKSLRLENSAHLSEGAVSGMVTLGGPYEAWAPEIQQRPTAESDWVVSVTRSVMSHADKASWDNGFSRPDDYFEELTGIAFCA